MTSREFDVVLLGATGFTGGLTAHYLAERTCADDADPATAGLRWALAGRNLAKLEAVRRDLAQAHPELADLALIEADSARPESMRALAARTQVLATTVGPYLQVGTPVVQACAEAGTDYVDLTGEPEFVDQTWLDLNETAVASGARLVHACGFDSVPHDLGAYFTVQQLSDAEPIDMIGVVRTGGTFSGGTFHSALGQFARLRQAAAAAKKRRAAEPRPEGRRVKLLPGKPHFDKVLQMFLMPLPTIDSQIVGRSARALAAYGPAFSYTHYAGAKRPWNAAAIAVGAGSAVLLAQLPPARALMGKLVKQGTGPDEARRDAAWFTVDFEAKQAGRLVRTRVSGGDPGYTETSKMIAECAMCLALDDNPESAGQVTTAQAMGDNLLARLQAHGITFEVVAD